MKACLQCGGKGSVLLSSGDDTPTRAQTVDIPTQARHNKNWMTRKVKNAD